jgi:hypothetical protein
VTTGLAGDEAVIVGSPPPLTDGRRIQTRS